MPNQKPWEASSFEKLEEMVDLQTVLKALKKAEEQRIYHKSAYLKRQAILEKAREMGITG